jgi:hypothetical protein
MSSSASTSFSGVHSKMRGWIILNVMAGIAGVSAVVAGTSSIGIKGGSLLALFLLALTLATKAMRGRA